MNIETLLKMDKTNKNKKEETKKNFEDVKKNLNMIDELKNKLQEITKQNGRQGPLLYANVNNINENKPIPIKKKYPEMFFHIQHLYFSRTNLKWTINGGYNAQLKLGKLNPTKLTKYFINYQEIIKTFEEKTDNNNDNNDEAKKIIDPKYFTDSYGLTILWLSFIYSTIDEMENAINIVNTYLTEKIDQTKYTDKINKEFKQKQQQQQQRKQLNKQNDNNGEYGKCCKTIRDFLKSGKYIPRDLFTSLNKLYSVYFFSQFINFDMYQKEQLDEIYELEINKKTDTNKENIDLDIINKTNVNRNLKFYYHESNDSNEAKLTIAKNAYKYIQENTKMSFAFQFEILNLAHHYDNMDRESCARLNKIQYFPSFLFGNNLPKALITKPTNYKQTLNVLIIAGVSMVGLGLVAADDTALDTGKENVAESLASGLRRFNTENINK